MNYDNPKVRQRIIGFDKSHTGNTTQPEKIIKEALE